MKTRTIHFSTLLLLLLSCVVRPAAAGEARPAAGAKHSLWKVEGKTNAVYLLGSVHLLKESDYPLPAPMESAYSNSQVLVFETDIDRMNDPATQLSILGKAQLPEGETLESQLSPELYARFSKRAEDAGLPIMMLQRLKPSMAAMTLVVLELVKLGLDPQQGLDQHFFKRAKTDGKQTMPLETLEFQISLVTDFSKQEGESLMKSTLDEIDTTRKYYSEILAAWKTGDAVALEKLMNEARRQEPVIYKRLLTDRNQRWVPQIEELLRGNKRALVVVGAGHLVGNEGVVELLRKKGWKITQL